MLYLLIYPLLGFIIGYVASCVGYAIGRKQWVAFVAALVVPLPLVYVMAAFAVGFMREERLEGGVLIDAALLAFALLTPFSFLGAWQYLLRLNRLRRK